MPVFSLEESWGLSDQGDVTRTCEVTLTNQVLKTALLRMLAGSRSSFKSGTQTLMSKLTPKTSHQNHRQTKSFCIGPNNTSGQCASMTSPKAEVCQQSTPTLRGHTPDMLDSRPDRAIYTYIEDESSSSVRFESSLGARTLLGAPRRTTSNKKLRTELLVLLRTEQLGLSSGQQSFGSSEANQDQQPCPLGLLQDQPSCFPSFLSRTKDAFKAAEPKASQLLVELPHVCLSFFFRGRAAGGAFRQVKVDEVVFTRN